MERNGKKWKGKERNGMGRDKETQQGNENSPHPKHLVVI
jgi:hypothetical protein